MWNWGHSDSIFRGGTVLMLNSPDSALPSFFDALWAKGSFRACADGAANLLKARGGATLAGAAGLPKAMDCTTGRAGCAEAGGR